MTAVEEGVRVLFFEPEHLGHQPAYVRALAEWLDRWQRSKEAVFAVSPELVRRLRDEDGLDLGRIAELRQLSSAEVSACTTGPIHRKALARWQVIGSSLQSCDAGHAHALFLDPLQLPLGLNRRLGRGRSVSGILFRPSVHGIYTTPGRPPRERLRDGVKSFSYGRMLRNDSLKAVLSLDPEFPAFAREHYCGGEKVRAIPDPIIELASRAAERSGTAPLVAPAGQGGRCSFLLFGALSERKGVKAVLQALELLSSEQLRRVRVVFAGRLDEDCRLAMVSSAARLGQKEGGQDALEVIDRFLPTEELAGLVDACDVVLAPYQRHVGSSGALVWAASHGKPVLAQEYGLVGHLVRRHDLGAAIDTSDVRLLADAMVRLAEPGNRRSASRAAGQAEFLAGRTTEEFARQVCEAVWTAAA